MHKHTLENNPLRFSLSLSLLYVRDLIYLILEKAVTKKFLFITNAIQISKQNNKNIRRRSGKQRRREAKQNED
jgi:hypothetical protein